MPDSDVRREVPLESPAETRMHKRLGLRLVMGDRRAFIGALGRHRNWGRATDPPVV